MNIKSFDKLLFEKFLEWEKTQPRKRSSYAKFCKYLSQNSEDMIISPQVFNGWFNGKYKPELKFIPVLVEKLGEEVYDVLDLPRPDHRLREFEARYGAIPDPMKDTFYADVMIWWEEWMIENGASRYDKKK